MTRPGIAVVGAGRMGRGLAHVFAYAGHPVALIDAKARPAGNDVAADAGAEIAGTLGLMAALGAFDPAEVDGIMSRVSFHPHDALATQVATAAFVFEAVPEVMAVKVPILQTIGAAAGPGTIVTSTTSTFLVESLAAQMPAPERFLNGHWLNPAFLVPLVEVSPAAATAPETTARFRALLDSVGKVPVVCKASPGFIVPRLQALLMNEAARMVEEGVATADEIDKATRWGLGFRFASIGVVEFIDWGGGDILHYASHYLREALGDDRFAAPDVIGRHMEKGATGLRAGKGFYDYAGRDLDAYRRETLARFVDLLRHYDLLKPPAG